jgi:hypothetical protein
VDVSTELSIYGSLLAETVVPGSSSRADGRKQKHKAMVTDHNQEILLNTVDGYVSRSKVFPSSIGCFPDFIIFSHTLFR